MLFEWDVGVYWKEEAFGPVRQDFLPMTLGRFHFFALPELQKIVCLTSPSPSYTWPAIQACPTI
jgi:hypothetical protein